MVLAALIGLTLQGGTTMGEVRSYLPPDLRLPEMPAEMENGWNLAMAAAGGAIRTRTAADFRVDVAKALERAKEPTKPQPKGPDVRTLLRSWPEKPSPEDIAKAEQALRPLEMRLRLLKAATERPVWFAPRLDASDRPSMFAFEDDFRVLAGLRQLGQALALRSKIRLAKGDTEGALNDVLLLRRAGDHLTMGYTTLITNIVGKGIVSIANRAAVEAAFHSGFRENEVALLASAWRESLPSQRYQNLFRYELDKGTLQFIAANPTRIDQSVSWKIFSPSLVREAGKYPILDRKATIRKLVNRYRVAIDNRTRPWYSQAKIKVESRSDRFLPKELDQPLKAGKKLTAAQERSILSYLKAHPNTIGEHSVAMATTLLPMFEESERRQEAFDRMTFALLMLRQEELARRESNRAPLVLMSALPKDPFSNGTLRYDSDRRVLWSVGPDGRDNGGRATEFFFLKPDMGINLPQEAK